MSGISGRTWERATRRLPLEDTLEVQDSKRRSKTVSKMLRGIIPLTLMGSVGFFTVADAALPGAILGVAGLAFFSVYSLLRSRRLTAAVTVLTVILVVALLTQPALSGNLGAVPFFAAAAAVAMAFVLPMRLLWLLPLGLALMFALLVLGTDPADFKPLSWHRTLFDGALLSAVVTVMVASGARGLSDLGLALDRNRMKAERLAGELEVRVAQRTAELTQRTQELTEKTAELEGALAEREELMRSLQEMAIQDPLTGLHNRRYWDEMSPLFFARAQRTGKPMSLALMDVDDFRLFNTKWDYEVGDEVLRLVGDALKKTARTSDVLVRLGGDEFLLLMPDTSVEEAGLACQRLIAAVRASDWSGVGSGVAVTLSVGLASSETTALKDVKSEANEALKAAKRHGRDRIAVAR